MVNQQIISLGFEPRKWSIPVFEALIRFSILVIHRGAGKTWLAVMKLVDSALRCNKPLALFGYIAPELKQAKGVAWEILKLYALRVPGTESNESELWVRFPSGAKIQLFGADHYDSIRGRHFHGVVIDEVADMKREVWSLVILPALANNNGWALFIGTPKGVNLFSELYHGALSDSSWHHSKLTCLDTDVYTAVEIEVMRKKMGERAFRQEMMCDFEASNDNSLISLDAARAAARRVLTSAQYYFAPRIMGVDVAWQGGDRSVIMCRQGLQAFKPVISHGVPEKTFASVVAGVCDKWKPHRIFIDTTGGYGGEVLSRLQERGYPAEPVIFSWKASEERFLNLRAEMWFKMAEWIKEGSIPNDEGLINELCAPMYHNNNAANRLTLESKADVKARIGVSPDCADALAISWAAPVSPTIDELGDTVTSLKTESMDSTDD